VPDAAAGCYVRLRLMHSGIKRSLAFNKAFTSQIAGTLWTEFYLTAFRVFRAHRFVLVHLFVNYQMRGALHLFSYYTQIF